MKRFLKYKLALGKRGLSPIAVILMVIVLFSAMRFITQKKPSTDWLPAQKTLSASDIAKKKPESLFQSKPNFFDGNVKKILAPENAILSPVAISAPLRVPVGGAMTSGFGYREHPKNGVLDFHTGVDIAAPEGTAISATLPGIIEEVGFSQIYGNYVVVMHSKNLQTRYCHCSVILVEEREHVRQGDHIAKVGSTGAVTGPHLHFELYADGKLADPLWVLKGDDNGGN